MNFWKIKTGYTSILLLIHLVLVCGSCGHNSPSTVVDQTAAPESLLPPDLTQKVAEALQYYFKLKDALVDSDSQAADYSAQKMKTRLVTIAARLKAGDTTVYPGDTAAIHNAYVIQNIDSMLQRLDLIAAAKEENCEIKRVQLQPLSDNFYQFLKKIELKNIKIYHVLCPMALNERGAFWLSQFRGIKNPYFGKKMLYCGIVSDSLY